MDIEQVFSKSKINKFHIGMLLICLFVIMMEGYNLVIFGAIVSNIINEWQISTVTAGLLGSAALVGMMVGSFGLGILADRVGRKRVTVLCLILFSLFTGISGFAQSPWQFAISRFFAGIGIGGAMPNAIGLLTDYVPYKSRNTMVAIATTGMQVGGILAPVIGLLLAPSLGWRFCLYVGFIPLLAVPIVVKYLPESLDHLYNRGKFDVIKKIIQKASPETNASGVEMELRSSKVSKPPMEELFGNRRFINTIMFWVVFFMGLLMIYGLNTWLPKLMEAAGYSLGSSLTFLIVLNSVGLLGTIILGRIADRMKDARKLLILLYIVGAIAMVMLSIKGGIVLAYILIGICGICVFGSQNISIAYVAHSYPGRIRTTGLGVCNTVGRIGGILGPSLGGVLLAAQLSMFYNFLVFAIPGVIAGAAYGIVRKDRGREK